MMKFDCPSSRSVVYFIEMVLPIALFGKNPLNIVMNGVTSDEFDVSVDTVRCVWIPMLKYFGIEDGLDLKIVKRAFRGSNDSQAGGEVVLKVPNVK